MKTTSRRTNKNSGNQRSPLWLVIALVSVLSTATALADQVCYTHVTAPTAPPNFGQPPLIDGSINNSDPRWSGPDFGWSNSFKYIFNNPDGPVIPDVIVGGLRDDTHLYLSVQANNSTPLATGASDPTNAVVFAFDPDNSGNKMQWLVIYPVAIGGTTGNKQNAQKVEFYWNQTSLSSPNTTTNYKLNPSWLPGAGGSPNSPCSTPGTTCIQNDLEGASWTMELAVPIVGPAGDPSTGLILPPTGLFGFYVDVLRVVNGGWQQAPWPSGNPIPGCPSNATCYPNQNIPQTSNGKPSGWGNGTIDPNPNPSCSGLYIGSQNLDISVSNPSNPYPPGSNAIDGMNPNIFHAFVHNTTANAVNNVVVNFLIADWGLPSTPSWQPVAVSQPPTGSTIPAGGIAVASNGWTPPNPSAYNYPHQHQCILATLSTNPTATFFTNSTAVQNMDFFDTSTVERPVTVSSKGYAVNPQNKLQQQFDIFVTTKQDTINPCPEKSTSAQVTTNCTPISQLTEIAEACRHTGLFLTATNNQQIELCQPVGSFGFVARHRGPVKQWIHTLTGPGLGKPDKKGVYHLTMPHDSTVVLSNVVDSGGTTGTGNCFKSSTGGAAFVALGMVLVGFVVYHPRRKERNKQSEV